MSNLPPVCHLRAQRLEGLCPQLPSLGPCLPLVVLLTPGTPSLPLALGDSVGLLWPGLWSPGHSAALLLSRAAGHLGSITCPFLKASWEASLSSHQESFTLGQGVEPQRTVPGKEGEGKLLALLHVFGAKFVPRSRAALRALGPYPPLAGWVCRGLAGRQQHGRAPRRPRFGEFLPSMPASSPETRSQET